MSASWHIGSSHYYRYSSATISVAVPGIDKTEINILLRLIHDVAGPIGFKYAPLGFV
jgi:hypothetical protein